MPVLRKRFSVGIEDRHLARPSPPGISITLNDDTGGSLFRYIQYSDRESLVGRRSIQFRPVSPGSPTPFLLASVGIADKCRGVRPRVWRGQIRKQHTGMPFPLQVRKPDTRPKLLLVVVPGGIESARKVLAPQFLSLRIRDPQRSAVQARELRLVARRQHRHRKVAHCGKPSEGAYCSENLHCYSRPYTRARGRDLDIAWLRHDPTRFMRSIWGGYRTIWQANDDEVALTFPVVIGFQRMPQPVHLCGHVCGSLGSGLLWPQFLDHLVRL